MGSPIPPNLTPLETVAGELATASGRLETDASALAASVTLANEQFGALAAWVEKEHPGATVTRLVKDPFVSVIVPAQQQVLTSIQLVPTTGWLFKQLGIQPGTSLNINYQQAPDSGYPWDQQYQRGIDEIANVGGVATEEVVFQDRFMVPTVNSPTSIVTNFTSVDAQVALMATYGIKPLVYLLPNPAYSAYAAQCTSPANTLNMMTTVINAVCGHLKGKVQGYVLFNELIQFGAYNANPFTNASTGLGLSYTNGALAQAVALVRTADPAAEIWFNTNHIETDANASNWNFFVGEIENLVAGVGQGNITGISAESHLLASDGNNVYTTLQSRINTLSSVSSLAPAIGEIDITDNTLLGGGTAGIPTRDATNASIVNAYFPAWLGAHVKPKHVIAWQYPDGSSWLNVPPQALGGSPYDRQANTTDGDSFTILGVTYYAHTPTPTGAPITPVGNGLTNMTVTPAIPGGGIPGGTSVTYNRGSTGSTFAFTGSLTTNGTQAAGNTLSLIATTMSGTVQPGTQGRHTIGFDVNGNPKAGYYALQQQLLAALGGTIPSAQSLIATTSTQRYFVLGLDQFGVPMVNQPTMQVHTSNTGIANVPNNQTVGLPSLPGTFLVTGVNGGVATITVSATNSNSVLVTSNAMTLTVPSSGGGGTSGQGPNAPAGLNTLINTGPITIAPSQVSGGQWSAGGVTFTNDSPSTKVPSTGEWAGNISLDPSGIGWRITYDPSLVIGGSPVRYHAPLSLALTSTGLFYSYRTIVFSSNFTEKAGTGMKLYEPRTFYQGNGQGLTTNMVGSAAWGGTLDPTKLQGAFFLQGPNGQSKVILPTSTVVGILSDGNPHTIEEIWQQDQPAGAGNGYVQMWIDGVLVIPKTTVTLMAATMTTYGWNFWETDPTYGGATGSNPPFSMSWTMKSLYIGGK